MEPTPTDYDPWQPEPRSKRRLYILWGGVGLALIIVSAILASLITHESKPPTVTTPTPKAPSLPQPSTETPSLTTQVAISGRQNIWDMAFLPGKELLFTERKGTLNLVKDGTIRQLPGINDVRAVGEGGLLGMAIDPSFAENRRIYVCYNSTEMDIRVVRWQIKPDFSGLERPAQIVMGIPANPSGRHSGCRLEFGIDGQLWIGTGDAANSQNPQNPQSLGGKILHVDTNGKEVAGGSLGGFDPRVFSYGHRNVQGIAFFSSEKQGVQGISVEHGSTVDDEVNLLKSGNFGWAPPSGPYDETNIPMTDKQRFPAAIDPIWSSGDPTQAPSGAAILRGEQWKGWDGAIAVAVLKAQHLKILRLDSDLQVSREERALENQYGRLRTAVQGPDGNLYVCTDNGADDKIIRIIPK